MNWLLVVVVAWAASVTALAQGVVPSRELITCGRERVHILDLNQRAADGTPKILLTWRAAGRADLPPEYQSLFRSSDECKAVDGGRRILITSSGGGVALVERASGAVAFYGRAVNAHSADLLPGGRVAVAASRDPRDGKGDSLLLFDVSAPGRELWRTELPSGHGVVWDEQRQIVWALADKDIRSYRLADWKSNAPKLTRIALFELPEGGGHELIAVPGTSQLAVSTSSRCWLFDRDKQTISPHPTLGTKSSIKSIHQHPATGQIVYVQADRPNWWSERIQFMNPDDAAVSIAGEQFYKARWHLP